MPAPPRRRFSVLDAVVVVAAAAVGFALVRPHLEPGPWYVNQLLYGGDDDPPLTALGWVNLVLEVCDAAQPLLLSAAGAVVVMRLRSPRPRLRRVARQPGFALCLAAVGFVAVASVARAASNALLTLTKPEDARVLRALDSFMVVDASPPAIGAVVLTVLAVMGLGRAFRPEPSWVDRAGRAVAGLLVANMVLNLIYNGIP